MAKKDYQDKIIEQAELLPLGKAMDLLETKIRVIKRKSKKKNFIMAALGWPPIGKLKAELESYRKRVDLLKQGRDYNKIKHDLEEPLKEPGEKKRNKIKWLGSQKDLISLFYILERAELIEKDTIIHLQKIADHCFLDKRDKQMKSLNTRKSRMTIHSSEDGKDDDYEITERISKIAEEIYKLKKK